MTADSAGGDEAAGRNDSLNVVLPLVSTAISTLTDIPWNTALLYFCSPLSKYHRCGERS